MTICPHSKAACTCQPQEGTLCPHGEQPPYEDGPPPEALASAVWMARGEEAIEEPVFFKADIHRIWAKAFERGRMRQAGDLLDPY